MIHGVLLRTLHYQVHKLRKSRNGATGFEFGETLPPLLHPTKPKWRLTGWAFLYAAGFRFQMPFQDSGEGGRTHGGKRH
jgi:hypothetical protein